MGRARKIQRREPTPREVEAFREEIAASGDEGGVPLEREAFREWLRKRAEGELWFFARWILGNDFLGLGRFHRDSVCPFLTDFRKSRSKLLMLPMGHLKTTVASRSMPLHVMVQPARGNLYAPGLLGRNMRVLLANESETKSKENLQYISSHMLDNVWLHWCWPDVFWEGRKEAPRWTDVQVDVKRTAISAEASITAVGIKTGFVGRYFDMIVADDIAALEASQNPPLMERAKKWRRAARTRLYDKVRGIFMGIGTHWPSAEDVYSEWKKDPAVEVMIRGIVEVDGHDNETPLWPEKYPLALIHEMRVGTDPQEWACWYMNRPASRGYTALEWDQLREYRIDYDEAGNAHMSFQEGAADERIVERYRTVARNRGFAVGGPDFSQATMRTRPAAGMDPNYFEYMRMKYPERLERGDH